MNKYIVDVPVKINIWIRPELQKKQFEVIKKARPSVLFIQSDGGRNENEWKLIEQNRQMIEAGINWECRVYKIYSDTNNGMYAMGKKTHDVIWSNVNECIFLEDDQIPSVSFFSFCKELLDRYRDDMRVFGISGYNVLGEYGDEKYDYFFCGKLSSWGYATWKHKDLLLLDYSAYFDDQYVLRLMRLLLTKAHYKQALDCKESGSVNNHPPGSEFRNNIARATQNALYIVPRRNMISCYGCGNAAAHAQDQKIMTKEEKKLFYSRTYELETIKHPVFVIRDIEYEELFAKRCGNGYPLIRLYRRSIKAIRMLRYEGVSSLFSKISKIGQKEH